MLQHDNTDIFETCRPRLLGLAYRILGSRADAEDAVQDTFIKWQNYQQKVAHKKIDNPSAWLMTACTRRSIDLLRSAHRARVDYVGSWLPEPLHMTTNHETAHETDSQLQLASSLSTAFMLMLERLTPKERAAYLLHDIFDLSYGEISSMLALQEATCRKLVSRAKGQIDKNKVRSRTPVERQEKLLSAFQQAITTGTATQLATLLSDDIRLSTDGGGKVQALLETLHGKGNVISFLAERLYVWWASYDWVTAEINGTRGFFLQKDSEILAGVTFAYSESGDVTDIYIMRNPDKLRHMPPENVH
ncbi:RNA polymerase sigma factor SigJ [Kiloniella laminariae]|uniref:RNA polymerase sigma factor SigJ n=1 Tax=Kiloniella laminariae TaxID=454162 RepID=UPI000367BA14|nr:RNA polymerase sigma factor SigJ [Kiloniella laminariae]